MIRASDSLGLEWVRPGTLWGRLDRRQLNGQNPVRNQRCARYYITCVGMDAGRPIYDPATNVTAVGGNVNLRRPFDLATSATTNALSLGEGAFRQKVFALTYSATIATNASLASLFRITATNGTAFTISDPTNARPGAVITYDIKNSSGGAMGGITWGAAFLFAGAFTNPANTKRRTISFYYDGTNWIETHRAAADI